MREMPPNSEFGFRVPTVSFCVQYRFPTKRPYSGPISRFSLHVPGHNSLSCLCQPLEAQRRRRFLLKNGTTEAPTKQQRGRALRLFAYLFEPTNTTRRGFRLEKRGVFSRQFRRFFPNIQKVFNETLTSIQWRFTALGAVPLGKAV